MEPNKNRPFQRYHAMQAFGFQIVFGVLFAVFGCMLSAIGLGSLRFPLGLGVFAALACWFAYRAYQGEQFEISVLAEFVKQQGRLS